MTIFFRDRSQRDDHCRPRMYRYEESMTGASVDEYGDLIKGSGYMQVQLRQYTILSRTRCGVWILADSDKRQFINLSWNKQFACETITEAAKSFAARKKRQRDIHIAKARRAERALLFHEPENGWVRVGTEYSLPLAKLYKATEI